MTDTIVVIMARKGSRGVVGKNLSLLAGRPVVQYSLDYALATIRPVRAFVSTDDDAVAELAVAMSIDVISRPAHLATDESLTGEAFRHAVMEVEARHDRRSQFTVLLQANVPIRPPGLIDQGCEILESTDADSVTPLISHKFHPFYSVRVGEGRRIERWLGVPPPRRQQLPPLFNYGGGCWTVRSETLRWAEPRQGDPHWMFGTNIIGIPYEWSEFVEIDDPVNLEWAEFLLARRDH